MIYGKFTQKQRALSLAKEFSQALGITISERSTCFGGW